MNHKLPTPEGLRRIAFALTDGIITGHDWPNNQDELTRMDAAKALYWLSVNYHLVPDESRFRQGDVAQQTDGESAR